MKWLLPILTGALLFCSSCQKDEVQQPQVLSFTLNHDTLYYRNNLLLSTSFSPVESLHFSMDISQTQSYSYLVNGTNTRVKSIDEEFSGSVATASLFTPEMYSNSQGVVTLDLYSLDNEYYSSRSDTITLLPHSIAIEVTNLSISPSTIVNTEDEVFSIDSTALSSLTLSLSLLSTDTNLLTIGDTTVHLPSQQQNHTITLPITTLLGKDNHQKSAFLPLTISHSSGIVGYRDTLFLNILSHFPDPYEPFSWHTSYEHNQFHQEFNIDPHAHISLTEAWKSSRGEDITIAIIDQGFEDTHEDLFGNIIGTYNAEDDTPHVNSGWNTNHGTACAGLSSAPINGKGVSGSAPDSKLILIAAPSLSDASIIKAFEYARTNGARVISCSWGSYNVSQIVSDKIEELYDEGIVIVFACGNDSQNLDEKNVNDESELPTVIGVGASNENNGLSSYSNYGTAVDCIAPGGSYSMGVLSVDLMGSSGSNYQMEVVDNNYAFHSGTSFSAPIVAGVAALVLSKNPALSPEQVRTILINSCEKIGNNAHYNAQGFDVMRAYGKINAAKAVTLAQSYR